MANRFDEGCPHCGTSFDGTGTCMFDCSSDWCGRCNSDVPRFTRHLCSERRGIKKLTKAEKEILAWLDKIEEEEVITPERILTVIDGLLEEGEK